MADRRAPGDEPLARSLSELSGLLLGEETLDALLDFVVSLAKSSLARVDGASISLSDAADPATMRTSSATSTEVRDLDGVQYESQQGPCVEAMRTGEVVDVMLASAQDRWPEFGPTALAAGFEVMLSTPLSVPGRTTGALNLYGRGQDPFSDDDRQRARRFAEQAAVVLANATTLMSAELANHQLQEALVTRDVIGQAKGILMAQEHCTPDEAFDILRRASQRTNRKLRDVAQELIEARRTTRPATDLSGGDRRRR